jgi:hypothetical protein
VARCSCRRAAQRRELRELPDLVARPLDHCGTLWITPEGAPPTRMECSLPGGKGGGRPPTRSDLSPPAPRRRRRASRQPDKPSVRGRRIPRRSIRVSGSAGAHHGGCPRGGRGQGAGGRARRTQSQCTEHDPRYVRRPDAGGERSGRVSPASPFPGWESRCLGGLRGDSLGGSPQSLPAVKRTRRAARGVEDGATAVAR